MLLVVTERPRRVAARMLMRSNTTMISTMVNPEERRTGQPRRFGIPPLLEGWEKGREAFGSLPDNS